jgi:two-component system sensor histidine kinase AlgZ
MARACFVPALLYRPIAAGLRSSAGERLWSAQGRQAGLIRDTILLVSDGTTRLEVPVPGSAPLIPRELVWLYPIAPIAAAALMVNDLTSMPLAKALQKIGAMYVPFLALTTFFHLTYTLVMPRLLVRLPSKGARFALHSAVIVGGALVVGELVRPLHNALCGLRISSGGFGISTVLISLIMMVPAMIVQGLRNRTRAVEALAVAQRQATLKAQLEALQARTNPHFFFNSINTVASLIADDPVLAERTLERLAELFRYALEAGKVAAVPLQREFDMVRDYLAIQQARFGDHLLTSVTLDPEVARVEVPPLVLQPLVENAILHGLANRREGRVDVSARREGGNVLIEVRDDGPGPGASAHQGTQTSMRELTERLRLFFGEPGRVEVSAAPGGGCLVTLAVPVPQP